MSHIDIVGQEQFAQTVSTPGVLVIVDFWAERCGPCRMLGPILEQMAAQYAEKVIVAKINVDESDNQGLAMQYSISSIPRVIFFANGNVVDDFVGVQAPDAIAARIDMLLANIVEQDAGQKHFQPDTEEGATNDAGCDCGDDCDCDDGCTHDGKCSC